MKINKNLFLILLLILVFPVFIIAQSDPVDSPDSLYLIRSSATGLELAYIDLEIARYHFPENRDSIKFYIQTLEKHLEKRYDKRIDAFVKKFKGYLAQQDMESSKSMDLNQESYLLFNDLKDYREMGWISIHLGTSYYNLGNFTSATEQYLQALAYFEQVNHLLGIAQAYNELGRISYQTGQISTARDYFESALDIYNQLDTDLPKNMLYNNLGIIHLEKKELNEALKNFQKASRGYKKSGDYRRLAFVCGNIGLCYEELGQRDSALIFARRALSISDKAEDIYGTLTATINLGYFHRLENRFDSSLICLNEALIISQEKQLPVYVESVYNELTDLYAAKKDFKTAYLFHVKKDSIHNIILDEASEKKIEELLFSYKQKIKEQELIQLRQDQRMQSKLNLVFILLIALFFCVLIIVISGNRKKKHQKLLLEKKNILLSTANANLEQSKQVLKNLIENKNKLFSIVAHDLRNPIAAVSGFSELLIQNYESLDDESRKEYIEQIYQASMRTLSLLENLLLWARSQMDELIVRKTNINVQKLIENSVVHLMSSLEKKKISLNITIKDDFDLNVDIEMIKAVLRNLVSNAIKFSYPGKSIDLSTSRTDDSLCISVEDY
jgi:signal transduction histidine kinase/Tfp pilus assembly protein PilF